MKIDGIRKPNNTGNHVPDNTGNHVPGEHPAKSTTPKPTTPKLTITPGAISPPREFSGVIRLTKKTASLFANPNVRQETLDAYKKDCVHRMNLALGERDLKKARDITIEYYATILSLNQQDNIRSPGFYPVTTGIASGDDFIQITFNSLEQIFVKLENNLPADISTEFSREDMRALFYETQDLTAIAQELMNMNTSSGAEIASFLLSHISEIINAGLTQRAIMDYEDYLADPEESNEAEYERYYSLNQTYNNSPSDNERLEAGKQMLRMVLGHKQNAVRAKLKTIFEKLVKKHKDKIDRHFEQGNKDLALSIDGMVFLIERKEENNHHVYLLKTGDSLEDTARVSLPK